MGEKKGKLLDCEFLLPLGCCEHVHRDAEERTPLSKCIATAAVLRHEGYLPWRKLKEASNEECFRCFIRCPGHSESSSCEKKLQEILVHRCTEEKGWFHAVSRKEN
jgi:hypothetical protein